MAEPKTLILCFDGTTNEYSANNSNIAKLYSILSKDHPTKQACYYQPGLGQYFDPGTVNPLLQKFAQGADWGFAWYLYQHIIDGYKFMVQNWNEGDSIYIFGFSRGAYTARCVAGMVQKIGLLAKDNDQILSFAYGLYERTDTEGIALASSYKRAFARDVKIEFVGCFDTVASVGAIVSRELPYTSNNPGVKTFRHALALDEHRFRFQCSQWVGPQPFPADEWPFPATPPVRISASLSAWFQGLIWKLSHPVELYYKFEGSLDKAQASSPKISDILSAGLPTDAARKLLDTGSKNPAPISEDHSTASAAKTEVKEVWFVGCHSDIGGCAVADNVPRSLGDITLRWMVKELLSLKYPILWKDGALSDLFGADLSNDSVDDGRSNTPSISGQQPDLDALDCTAPIHDSLKYPNWWLFEILPLSWTWQDAKGNWYRQWRPNLARGRYVEGNPILHHSVRQRMADAKLAYKPKANIRGTPVWE
jgi:uncharacterized protein (DUF2235 family)